MKKDNKKYAVLKVSGKQYRVAEGEEILVDKLSDTKKPEIEVLLFVNDGKVSVGKPNLKDVKVSLDVINEEEKGEKLRIFKYKSKSRYRRRAGFRSKMTRLLIKKIS